MEKVHAVWEYYDGPRTGIADYRGHPHYFTCSWDPSSDDYSSTFALSPIKPETLALAMEQWALWREWEVAFHSGQASSESHPGRGGRNKRYDELQQLLQLHLDALPSASLMLHASFQPLPDIAETPVGVMRELQVEWSAAT